MKAIAKILAVLSLALAGESLFRVRTPARAALDRGRQLSVRAFTGFFAYEVRSTLHLSEGGDR
jgi:hypothetical protein